MTDYQLRLSEDSYKTRSSSYVKEHTLKSDSAVRNLMIKLRKEGIRISQVIDINRGRYKIAKVEEGDHLLIIYKTVPFHDFGRKFIKKNSREIGDTINLDDLKNAIKSGVKKIYAIYGNGEVYSISTDEFLSKSIPWVNGEGKNVQSASLSYYTKELELI